MENRWFRPENIKSIPEILFDITQLYREKSALIYYGNKITYYNLYSYSYAISKFIEKSTKPNGKIAIIMPNIPQFVFCYYGTLLVERIVVPINFMSIANDLKLKKANQIKFTEEIEKQLHDSRPDIIFVVDFLYPALMKMDINWPCTVVVTSVSDFLPFPLKLIYPLKALKEGKYVNKFKPGTLRLKDLLKDCEFLPPRSIAIDKVVQFQYTGGTTGIPGVAKLTHANLISNIFQAREMLNDLLIDGQEVVLGALPFFHIYGLTVGINITLLSLGGTVILMPLFTPREAVKNISKYGVTVFPGVNRMYQAITTLKRLPRKNKLRSLRVCISGAGPISQEVVDKFKKLTKSAFIEGYGLSETSPVVSIALPQDLDTKKKPDANLLGRPLVGTKIKIIDEEIAVSGPQVMELKHNLDRLNDFSIFFEGDDHVWFRTGDMGYLENGCLYLTDRKKDLIKVMGENVYASRIESAILKYPGIAEVFAVGMPDTKKGEMVVACIKLKPGSNTQINYEKEITFFMRRVLNTPYHYIPSRTLIFESFEEFKNPIGKILKRKLKEEVEKRFQQK